ncbi:carboxymethylenebutenolidase homolog isoform X1 [Gadus chalcogrammus]|uniref:carboxymethylenebutenolidase homolog isoform X1 n=2 Tax=Gadus chalcogrammus TaxID=1042646 RepID=UPI0024C489D3|nr:carboxymethylenebutenolidase homolog isoform X1 [Gadus chalcogrammus]
MYPFRAQNLIGFVRHQGRRTSKSGETLFRWTYLVPLMANEAKPCPCDIGDRMDYGGLGQEVQIEHIKSYVVKPSSGADKAVIVIHDIYGWTLPNTRYMADMLAENGYIAVCPDFYVGKDPWSPTSDWSKFQEWCEDKKPTVINREVEAVLRFLKEQCGVRLIGSVGFCWGGVAVHHLALNYPHITAGVSVYGIIKERGDCYELKSPVLFIFAEKDEVVPLEQVSVLQAGLKEKCSVDHQVKIFPEQSHGFVHRRREDINPSDRPHILEARSDMLHWLNKFM